MQEQLVWLITGTSQGFGRRLVRSALARGDKVIATARNLEKVKDLDQQASSVQTDNLAVLRLDVTSEKDVIKSTVEKAIGIWGRVDVLVNNAAYGYPGIVEEGGTDWIRAQFEVSFFGMMEVTNAVLPHMRSRRKGTLVNMGSRSAWKPEVPFIGPYAASKAAVRAITETLAVELTQFNIRVLLVEPGGFLTEGAYGYPSLQTNLISDYDEMRTRAAKGFSTIREAIKGDPDKAMDALVDVVRGEGKAQGREWPGYLVLGEDAEADIKKKIKKMEDILVEWSDVTRGVYLALIFWSPPPIITNPSEKNYRSRLSPNKPLSLPTLEDPSEVDLTIVIPAYNETARLPAMLATTIDHLTSISTKSKRTYEILIVDDGSSDGTTEASLKLAQGYPKSDIRVATLEKNLGKGGAVRHGMLHGRGKRLLMVDADGASRFEDLELLWRAMDGLGPEDAPSFVVGSRAHLVKTEAVVKRSVLRNILMYGLHTILRIVGVGHIRDTQCGFKLFSRSAAQQIFPAQHLPTWIFDVELLLLAKELGIPVTEVPVEWHEVAGSKLNVVTASLEMLRDLLILRANHVLGRWGPSKSKKKQ